MKDKFQKTIEELNKEYFKNYWEMEKLFVAQLKKKGQEYFIKNEDMGYFLGKFESTVKASCEICEKLGYNKGDLIQFYLHLNDIPNVKIQQKHMKDSQYYFIYKDYHKYQDSGKVLESKYVSIKYDKRVEKFVNWVFEKADYIDRFITQEWDGMLPPKIRVIFMNHVGPGPYNSALNETYLPVKGMKKKDVMFWVGAIVHETFHLVNCEIIKKTKFGYDPNMDSFKVLDEGYAQLIQYKFSEETTERRIRSDYYSRKMAIKGSFSFYDLKDKWAELFTEAGEIDTYALALSFAYFLEDKFGHEKFKNVFFPVQGVKENTWLEYVENYFDAKMDDLIDEWKQGLIESDSKSEDKQIESVEIPEMCLVCKSYDDPKEKLICILHRYKLRNNRKFKCRGFKNINE